MNTITTTDLSAFGWREKAMAEEIFNHLRKGTLACAGNLTNEKHLVEICGWLTDL